MTRWARGAVLVAAGAVGVALARRRARDEIDLRGAVALVTGGSRGLGLLLARELAREGARVVICARDGAELERARTWLAGEGAAVTPLVCDVSDAAAVERMVADVHARHGAIDVLVNNAGIIEVGPVATMTAADFATVLATNFWGTVHSTLAVLPAMRQRRRGRIVNVTSIGGKVAMPRLLPYDAAKFAAVGFSEGLAAEVAGDRVKVVTIVPGLMRTGSYLNAVFRGDAAAESKWFEVASTFPVVSMDAERAARQIVRATRRGEAVHILSAPAVALATLHGVLPGATVRLIGVAARLVLPPEGADARAVRGMDLEARQPRWLRALTTLGRAAARRFGQYPGTRAA